MQQTIITQQNSRTVFICYRASRNDGPMGPTDLPTDTFSMLYSLTLHQPVCCTLKP